MNRTILNKLSKTKPNKALFFPKTSLNLTIKEECIANEHDIIKTLKEIKREGSIIPKDTKGTIVHVFKDRKAYLVEFNSIQDNPTVTVYVDEISS